MALTRPEIDTLLSQLDGRLEELRAKYRTTTSSRRVRR
jgi:hypothetical protein